MIDFLMMARRQLQQQWSQSSGRVARELLNRAMQHPEAPADLAEFAWAQEPFVVARHGNILWSYRYGSGPDLVLPKAEGLIDFESPFGAASMPYWYGWDAEHRVAILCCGP